MKKEVGAALTAALFLTSCRSPEGETGAATPASMPQQLSETLVPSNPASEVPSPQAGDVSTVDLAVFPATLPPAVKAQIPNVVALRLDVDAVPAKSPTIPAVPAFTLLFSGVRVGTDVYLSAGHGVKDDHNKYFKNTNVCGKLSVDTETLPLTTAKPKLSGRTVRATRAVGSFINDEDSLVPDVSLIQAPTLQPPDLPYSLPTTLRTHNTALPIGAPLYLVNYEPLASGSSRDPNEHQLSKKDRARGLSSPAIVGGVVVSYNPNGSIVLVSGSKGYGHPADTLGRGGESGGPVYDEKGRLIGLSDRGSAVMSLSDIEADTGRYFTGIAPNAKLTEEIIQPITPKLLKHYAGLLAARPFCSQR